MHAVIKMVSFLVFGAAMATGEPQLLFVGALLVLPLYFFASDHRGHALTMLKRLRWLFLSILVVYLFFTPGQLIWTEITWGPTVEGVVHGLLRIAALVLLVLAVNWLIKGTEQADFLGAVLWCLQPLAWLGFPHERLAVRISLTLEAVSQVRSGYRQHQRDSEDTQNTSSRLTKIAQTAHRLFRQTVAEAETTETRTIELPQQTAPPLIQWLVPVIIGALFVGVKWWLPEVPLSYFH